MLEGAVVAVLRMFDVLFVAEAVAVVDAMVVVAAAGRLTTGEAFAVNGYLRFSGRQCW
jgi:hypothetical protein